MVEVYKSTAYYRDLKSFQAAPEATHAKVRFAFSTIEPNQVYYNLFLEPKRALARGAFPGQNPKLQVQVQVAIDRGVESESESENENENEQYVISIELEVRKSESITRVQFQVTAQP